MGLSLIRYHKYKTTFKNNKKTPVCLQGQMAQGAASEQPYVHTLQIPKDFFSRTQ